MKNALKSIVFAVTLVVICCTAVAQTTTARPADLTASRDSLLRLLTAHPAANQARIDILYNLADVSLALSNDKFPLVQLWDEGIRQKNSEAIIHAGRSLTLDYLNRAKLDSADTWMEKCRETFSGPLSQPTLKYLQLMRDIRDMGDQAAMARRLINEQLHIGPNADPYDRMTILYKLGTLALTEWNANEKIDMKSWDSYMEEGYRIAQELPFVESYNFRHQFLVALNFVSIDYVKQFIRLNEEYRTLPQMKNRPFLSRRSDILACTRMFGKGEQIGCEEADRWFNRFCELTTRYPYDCQTPYDYYFYAQALPYYRYTGHNEKVIECCDSVIANAPKYKFDNSWHYQLRGETLGKMGRWQAAYDNAVTWMSVKDSLASVSSQAKLMELQTQYDVDRLQYETEVSRQRSFFFLAVALLLIIVLGIYIVYSRRLRKKNRELVDRIRKQEAAEAQVEAVGKSVSEEQLTPEEQLFRRIQQLLENPDIFTNSKLRREDLAEMLGTNFTYVADAIRTCTGGKNVSEYINSKRVRHARHLFETQPATSIDEVADLCGFASRSRFHTAFKQQYDMTPGEFRKAIENE